MRPGDAASPESRSKKLSNARKHQQQQDNHASELVQGENRQPLAGLRGCEHI
jgi:hypothetical protein